MMNKKGKATILVIFGILIVLSLTFIFVSSEEIFGQSVYEITPSSITYQNPDGSFTKSFYSGQEFYDDGSGIWNWIKGLFGKKIDFW